MVLMECENKKCPYIDFVPDEADVKHCLCEVLFRLVEGTETFSTPDGKNQKSMFFEIRADSEAEREQKRKRLRECFGEKIRRSSKNLLVHIRL